MCCSSMAGKKRGSASRGDRLLKISSIIWCVHHLVVCVSSVCRDLMIRKRQNNEDLPGKQPPPERHLLDDGILAMMAGADTSSSAITSIFYCILSHPEAYAALQEEVDRFYPPGEDVCNTANHRDMHYLTAVMYVTLNAWFPSKLTDPRLHTHRNESLRLFPPAPTSTPRQVPHNAAGPVVLGSLSVLHSIILSSRAFSSLTQPAFLYAQGAPSGNARLRPALHPAPRRAQLRRSRRVLARTLARRVRPPPSRKRTHPSLSALFGRRSRRVSA